jgi:hypothetical protein
LRHLARKTHRCIIHNIKIQYLKLNIIKTK